MKDKRFFGFVGMNNLRQGSEYQLDDRQRVIPRIVLNADVLDNKVKPRGGYQKITALTNCHSLWKGSRLALCVADGSNGPALHQFSPPLALEICDVEGPTGAPLYYAEAEGTIYLSNGFWKQVYDGTDVASWGLPLPPIPAAIPCAGNLPAGRYSMCYTYYDGDRLGGNGPILTVEWEGGASGIKLLNLPDNAYFWLSQPDGEDLYLVTPNSGEITEPYYTQPLPTLGVTQVPALKHLAYGHGRIWGTQGSKLRFSDPFRYEWFREANTEPFNDDLIMVAPYMQGVFVSSINSTWSIEGNSPLEWKITRVGDGAIEGTLVYALVEGGGYEISRTMSQLPSPVWMGTKGIVVGTNTGHLVHLTEGRLKINPKTQGAGLYRTIDGEPQIVMSLAGAPLRPPDAALQTIFATGKLH